MSIVNDKASRDLIDAIVSAVEAEDYRQLETLEAQAQEMLSMHMNEIAATSRRSAILSALSELGYEVTEDMQTAWVKDKRIVVSKQANHKYGVEIGGNAASGKLQFRCVRFQAQGEATDSRADVSMEKEWCDEFYAMKTKLGSHGGECDVEKAMQVGAVPLKVIQRREGNRRDVGKKRKTMARSTK